MRKSADRCRYLLNIENSKKLKDKLYITILLNTEPRAQQHGLTVKILSYFKRDAVSAGLLNNWAVYYLFKKYLLGSAVTPSKLPYKQTAAILPKLVQRSINSSYKCIASPLTCTGSIHNGNYWFQFGGSAMGKFCTDVNILIHTNIIEYNIILHLIQCTMHVAITTKNVCSQKTMFPLFIFVG